MLTAVLMVKNEAHVMVETLTSLIAGIQHIFVLDTGSRDNTVQVTKDFFVKNAIQGEVIQEDFIDFATSRNRAMDLARSFFPESTFFLMIDAEWHLRHPNELVRFCQQEAHHQTPLYSLRMKVSSLDYTVARLFRASAQIKFKGRVHEVPEILAGGEVPSPIFLELQHSQEGKEKSRERWRRDAELLLEDYNESPENPRTVFYLAQTYQCLGDLEKAYYFYQIREKLNGWTEENFITLYRLGCVAEALSQYHSHITWATAMEYYLKAHTYRASRIEPLIKLADHYWPTQIPVCYLFAHRAYEMDYPSQDILFIEKEMYKYTRYEIMSRCAWYVGEYELGESATLLALEVHPEMQHLHNNLKLYQEKNKKPTINH